MNAIVCIPHAGGGASAFGSWQRTLGSRVIAVTLPGRESRLAEAALTDILAMAAEVASLMRARALSDVTLFGHSMGALVAYEAARLLHKDRVRRVSTLVASGCQAPCVFTPENLSALQDDQDFLSAVGRYGGLSDEVLAHPELVAYALPVLRSDLGACDRYRYRQEGPLDLPILALAGAHDPRVPVHDVRRWQRCTRDRFRLRVFEGGHFFVQSHLDEVIAEVLAWSSHDERRGHTCPD